MTRVAPSSSVAVKSQGLGWLRRLLPWGARPPEIPARVPQSDYQLAQSPTVAPRATTAIAMDVEALRSQFDQVSRKLDEAMRELARKDEELDSARRESLCDPLTGLYNRRAADVLLGREIALANRHTLPLCMAVLDVDRFKQVNDTFGHAFGDKTLVSVAEAIRQSLRKTDLAFRMGGDEFVVALPQTNLASAAIAMEKLRSTLTASWSGHPSEFSPTLSIGLVQQSATTRSWQTLLESADEALYCGKRRSRDCVVVHSLTPAESSLPGTELTRQ
jgi:diguanylate cyclase (GGDEF)-like protein